MMSEDFLHLDKALDQVEQAFKQLAAQEDLMQPFIERWRWDVPSIYIRWNDSDTIQKNITAYLRLSNPHEHLAVEVNAWRDRDQNAVRTRRWRHADRSDLVLPVSDQVLWNTIYDAYTYVSDWSEAMLTQVATTPILNSI